MSYGNQKIDLLCKLADWFPYDTLYLFISIITPIIITIIIITSATAVSHMFCRNRTFKVQSYQQILNEKIYSGILYRMNGKELIYMQLTNLKSHR